MGVLFPKEKKGERKMKKVLAVMIIGLLCFSMFSMFASQAKATATFEWSEPQQLTTDPAGDEYASIMQESSGKVWLVWFNFAEGGGHANIMYKTSSNGGASWSDPLVLVPDVGDSGGTSLLQDSTGRIWVAWGSGLYVPRTLFKVYYITSDNGGLSWSTPRQVTNPTSGDDNIPNLIEVSGEIWIVYCRGGHSSISYVKTGDGGTTWSSPVPIAFGGDDACPDAMVDSTGKIWVVWARGGLAGDIYYKTSSDNGVTWSENIQLTNRPYLERLPSLIEGISGRILVFYSNYDGTPQEDVWYMTTEDGGSSWSAPNMLTSNAGSNVNPNPALIHGEVWAIWQSDRSGNLDIWLSKRIEPTLSASIDVEPDTLNLGSKGKWITCYVELPEGYDVADINALTVTLNGTVPAELAPTAIGDYDNDGVPDLMVKFNRTAVVQYVVSQGVEYANVTMTVSGQLKDGTSFQGSDVVRVSGLTGDVNCDGKVNMKDVGLVACAFWSRPGGPRWNDNANFAEPWDIINLADLGKVARHYGEHYP